VGSTKGLQIAAAPCSSRCLVISRSLFGKWPQSRQSRLSPVDRRMAFRRRRVSSHAKWRQRGPFFEVQTNGDMSVSCSATSTAFVLVLSVSTKRRLKHTKSQLPTSASLETATRPQLSTVVVGQARQEVVAQRQRVELVHVQDSHQAAFERGGPRNRRLDRRRQSRARKTRPPASAGLPFRLT
jgi:hypothetical protein